MWTRLVSFRWQLAILAVWLQGFQVLISQDGVLGPSEYDIVSPLMLDSIDVHEAFHVAICCRSYAVVTPSHVHHCPDP